MSWSIVYLLLAITCVIGAVWRAARGGNLFLVLTGFVLFFSFLFRFYVPSLNNLRMVDGLPTLGSLLEYVLLPGFLALALFSVRTRR